MTLNKFPRRLLAGISAVMLALVPAYAVFKEKDLQQTLLVLLYELKTDYEKTVRRNAAGAARIQSQHQSLVNLVEQSNELSLMLYSQPQNHTFDLTYALHQVTDQYEKFDANRMPFDEIIQNMSTELDRYSKLAQTLRNMPPVKIDPSLVPQLGNVMDSLEFKVDTLLNLPSFALKEGFRMDEETAAVRDSCLFYAESMVEHYMETIKQIEADSEDYADTDKLLKEAYDYAQERYHVVQNKVFLHGQRNYFVILKGFGRNVQRAVADMKAKYSPGAVDDRGTYSAWRGPIVAAYAFVMLVILIFAMILATFIVKLLVKRVKFFQMQYFQEHKGILIALTGVIIFSVIILFNSYSKGPDTFINLASRMMGEYAWLLAAIFTSMLIRLNEQQTYPALKAYLPTLRPQQRPERLLPADCTLVYGLAVLVQLQVPGEGAKERQDNALDILRSNGRLYRYLMVRPCDDVGHHPYLVVLPAVACADGNGRVQYHGPQLRKPYQAAPDQLPQAQSQDASLLRKGCIHRDNLVP